MDTSSSYIVDNTELQTLVLASIQTLKLNNKKCGTEEIFQLVLESLDSDIDKESFDKILEFLIKNQKVKTSCYANKDKSKTNPKSKRDSVIILGDSMIKHANGWQIVKKLKPDEDRLPMQTAEWHQQGRSGYFIVKLK